MPPVNEEAIKLAIQAYINKEFDSIHKCADQYGVTYSTLQKRLQNDRQSHQIGAQKLQKLSPVQERYLAEWIALEDRASNAPSHGRVRQMAEAIARENGDHTPCGKNWVDGFLKRNPHIKTMVGKSIEASRVNCSSKEIIAAWFNLLQSLIDQFHIKTENIWNFDEHGIALGCGVNGRVLAPIQEKKMGKNSRKKTYIKTPEDREWVSVIEAISAVGRAISPLIIFKGKNLQSTWFPADLSSTKDWHWTVSENAWTSNEIGLKWLEKKFLPETAPKDRTEWRLLICDGHGSHATVEFMKKCKDNKVIVLYLPPHCSHLLQPLDVACFSALKSKYRKELTQLSSLDDSAPVKKHNFINIYNKSRIEALINHNIRAGFRGTGICPFNPHKVLNSTQLNENHTIQRYVAPEPIYDYIFNTPKGPKDVYTGKKFEDMSGRDFRGLQGKLAKALSKKNVEIAALKAQVAKLEKSLEDIGGLSKKRKRVQVDQNERFATIDQIVAAQEEARQAELKEAKKKPKFDAQKISDELQKAEFESLCSQFQI